MALASPSATVERPYRTRRTLTQAELQKLGQTMRHEYRWNADPRTFQLSGVRAQLEGIDTVIQASTGSGKTAIAAGPHLWPTSKGKVTIMVCPLLSLEEEMVKTFESDFGLKAVTVHSKNGAVTQAVSRDIIGGVYQIVLVSPEMLQSRAFLDSILRQQSFCNRVLSLVVDEVHCVSHWGANFRKKFGTLGTIRAFLPRGTPVLALSATLTPRVRRDIQSKLHFPKAGSSFLNVGNHRLNVSIVVRSCEHPLRTYADLDFVIPDQVNLATDISKTYIYADDIAGGSSIIDHLNSVLKTRQSCNQDLSHTIRPFNATMSQEYRNTAMEAFRVGTIRILVCTDAAGMGCNISDIDVVVQWKLPATLSNFIQRAGRAARGHGKTGLAVLLVERAAYSTDPADARSRTRRKPDKKAESVKSEPTENVSEYARRLGRQAYADDHGVNRGLSAGALDGSDDIPPRGTQPSLDPEAVDEGLLSFVLSVECRRKVWGDVFENEEVRHENLTVPCCDICAPELFEKTRPGVLPTTRTTAARAPTRGQPAIAIQAQLEDWRQLVYMRDHAYAQYGSTGIIDDKMISILAAVGPMTEEKFQQLLEKKWIWWDTYKDELLTLMQTWAIPTITKSRTKRNVSATTASQGNDTLLTPQPTKRQRQTSSMFPPTPTSSTSMSQPSIPSSSSVFVTPTRNHWPRVSTSTSTPTIFATPTPTAYPRTPVPSAASSLTRAEESPAATYDSFWDVFHSQPSYRSQLKPSKFGGSQA